VELSKVDSLFLAKLYVMAKMGLLPTDERVKMMSPIQWLLLFKMLVWIDKVDRDKDFSFWKLILGIGNKKSLIPLSLIIRPESHEEILKLLTEDLSQEEGEISDKESKELEGIFMTDIDYLVGGKSNAADIDEKAIRELEEKLGVLREEK